MSSPPMTDSLAMLYRADVGMWQDTARTSRAVADGDVVQRWDDASGNGVHLFFDNGHSPFNCAGAVLKTGQLGSLPVARFDGATTGFKLTEVVRPVARTMYAVVRTSDTGSSPCTLVCGNKPSLQWRLDTRRPRLVDAVTADIGFANTTLSLGVWTQIDVTWDFNSGTFGISGSDDGTVSLSNSSYASVRTIGCNFSDFSGSPVGEYLLGDLVAFIFYNNVHTSTQKAAVRAWISSEFGV